MEMELVVCKGVNAESPLTCSLGPGVPETPTPLGPHNVPASALRRAHAQSPTFPASSVAAAMDLSDCGGLNIASPARKKRDHSLCASPAARARRPEHDGNPAAAEAAEAEGCGEGYGDEHLLHRVARPSWAAPCAARCPSCFVLVAAHALPRHAAKCRGPTSPASNSSDLQELENARGDDAPGLSRSAAKLTPRSRRVRFSNPGCARDKQLARGALERQQEEMGEAEAEDGAPPFLGSFDHVRAGESRRDGERAVRAPGKGLGEGCDVSSAARCCFPASGYKQESCLVRSSSMNDDAIQHAAAAVKNSEEFLTSASKAYAFQRSLPIDCPGLAAGLRTPASAASARERPRAFATEQTAPSPGGRRSPLVAPFLVAPWPSAPLAGFADVFEPARSLSAEDGWALARSYDGVDEIANGDDDDADRGEDPEDMADWDVGGGAEDDGAWLVTRRPLEGDAADLWEARPESARDAPPGPAWWSGTCPSPAPITRSGSMGDVPDEPSLRPWRNLLAGPGEGLGAASGSGISGAKEGWLAGRRGSEDLLGNVSRRMGESSFQRQLACGEQPSAAKRRAMSLSLWRGDGSASQLEKNTEEVFNTGPAQPSPRTPAAAPARPEASKLFVTVPVTSAPQDEDEPMSPGEEGGSQFIPSPPQSLSERTASPFGLCSARSTMSLPPPPSYPIFKRHSKTVYLVRHGESEYNAADSSKFSKFEDPMVFDAPLTPKGRAQARRLGPQLRLIPRKNLVWVTSPLTRAIQTCLIGLEAAGLTAVGPNEFGPKLLAVGQQDEARKFCALAPVHVRAEIAEHLATSGDVGRPRSVLQQDFPQIAPQISELPEERWWWAPESNDAATKRFRNNEPKDAMKKRIGAFRRWVFAQEEGTTIVAFGHSTFFKELQCVGGGVGSQKRLANGEMVKIQI